MFLLRSAAAFTAATVLCGLATPAALADDPSPTAKNLPDGLYGTSDPKFDGVWRQSVRLLAQQAAGAVPAPRAVDWLVQQQCGDGSFTAYRADPDSSCDPKKTPADTNATALAGVSVAVCAAVAAALIVRNRRRKRTAPSGTGNAQQGTDTDPNGTDTNGKGQGS